MIRLTRLNGKEFQLNAELIEQIEKTPDTVITLTTGNNIVVTEPVELVVERIIEYRNAISKAGKDFLQTHAREGKAQASAISGFSSKSD